METEKKKEEKIKNKILQKCAQNCITFTCSVIQFSPLPSFPEKNCM